MKKEDLKYTDDLLFTVKYEKNYIHNILLYTIVGIIVLFFILINTAYIDERIRANGKVIPKTRVINIQALDGGIVDKVYVYEGQFVEKGEKLIKLNQIKNQSINQESVVRLNSNNAQRIRLIAQSQYSLDKNITLVFDDKLREHAPLQINIFNKKILELKAKIDSIKHQKLQKLSSIKDLEIKIFQLKKSQKLLEKELKIKEDLHKGGAVSIDVIYKLQRDNNNIISNIQSYKENIIEAKSYIDQMDSQMEETLITFRLNSLSQLQEIEVNIKQLNAKILGVSDRLDRTLLKAPSNGIIGTIFFSHENEVIKPAEVIMDMIPTDDRLFIETKVNPKDIAFIAKDQKATINITAYDFSIYGGLSGKIVEISADTTFDKVTNQYFYMVKIITDKNYLLKDGKKLSIMPGMIASVNIVTGKKSIFDFIFKPILKTYKNSLHER